MSEYAVSNLDPANVYRFQTIRAKSSSPRSSRYPNPLFDLAQTYLPATIKELFKWCRYYGMTVPAINTVIYKMASYPVTEVVIEGDGGPAQKFRALFERLRIRSFLIEAGLDRETFGNAFISPFFPFRKHLSCPSCRTLFPIDRVKYKYRGGKFSFVVCPKSGCGYTGEVKAVDRAVQSEHSIRLIRWSPENVDLIHNDITGETTYYYTIPLKLRNQIKIGRPEIIERVPQLFIEAAAQDKAIILDPSLVFHLKRSSMSREESGWGMPRPLPVLKDAYQLAIIKRANEAILSEHVLPFRILYPDTRNMGESPHMLLNLGDWIDGMRDEIKRWRQDPNHLLVTSVAVGQQFLGGQGRSMLLQQEMRSQMETIVVGMGCPVEFIFSGVSFCLDADSYIFTSAGLERIEDVACSEEPVKVATHRGVRPVILKHRTGEKSSVQVRTKLGLETYPSRDHRYLVLKPDISMGWCRAEDLQPGDKVAVRYGTNLWPTEPPELSVEVVAAKAYVSRKPVYDVRLPDKLTPELARLLGYLISEGSNTQPKRIGFSQKDPEVMGDFIRCVESVFGYRPNILKGSRGCDSKYEPINIACIDRQVAVGFLKALGVDGHSASLRVPPCIRKAPKELVCEFLRAYFEGDGGVTDLRAKQTVFAVSTSMDLLKEVQLLLLNLGVVSSRYPPYPTRHVGVLHIRSEFIDKYADDVGFISTRKSSVLTRRTPVGGTSVSRKAPYVKEALDAFRRRHFPNRSSWVFEPVSAVVTKDELTAFEVADLLGRDVTTVYFHVKKGRLRPSRTIPGEVGRFPSTVFARADVGFFLRQFGHGRRRPVPGRGFYGMTLDELTGADLSLVHEREPELAEKLTALKELKVAWDEVVSVEPVAGEVPMYDLTVDVDHSFVADGLVCHNSASNVALRALENSEFLGMREDYEALLRFIMNAVGRRYGWSTKGVNPKLKPFKTADDLQRRAFELQLHNGKALSRSTLLKANDFDPETEKKLLQQEQESDLKMLGEQQLVMAKSQQAAQQAAVPGEPGSPLDAVQSPLTADQFGNGGGTDIQALATQLAKEIRNLPETEQVARLAAVRREAPELYEVILSMLQTMPPSALAPNPEKLPPRRLTPAI